MHNETEFLLENNKAWERRMKKIRVKKEKEGKNMRHGNVIFVGFRMSNTKNTN